MEINTTRFGVLNITEDEIVYFPEGLVGFRDVKRYIVIPHGNANSPFSWFQSVDEGHLAFVIIEPQVFCYGYEVKISRDTLQPIELDDISLAKIYVIVVVGERPDDMTANLLGPLVINREKNIGMQVVQNTDKYHTRHKIIDELKRMEAR